MHRRDGKFDVISVEEGDAKADVDVDVPLGKF